MTNTTQPPIAMSLLDVVAEKVANGWDYGTHPREKARIILEAIRAHWAPDASLNDLLEHPWPENSDFGKGYNHLRGLMLDSMMSARSIPDASLVDKLESMKAVYNPMVAEGGDLRLIRNAVLEEAIAIVREHMGDADTRKDSAEGLSNKVSPDRSSPSISFIEQLRALKDETTSERFNAAIDRIIASEQRVLSEISFNEADVQHAIHCALSKTVAEVHSTGESYDVLEAIRPYLRTTELVKDERYKRGFDDGYDAAKSEPVSGEQRATLSKNSDIPATENETSIGCKTIERAAALSEQPVDQPNILATLIACDVMIRNLIHETEWENDPAIKLVLSENTRCIRGASTKRQPAQTEELPKGESGQVFNTKSWRWEWPSDQRQPVECSFAEALAAGMERVDKELSSDPFAQKRIPPGGIYARGFQDGWSAHSMSVRGEAEWQEKFMKLSDHYDALLKRESVITREWLHNVICDNTYSKDGDVHGQADAAEEIFKGIEQGRRGSE